MLRPWVTARCWAVADDCTEKATARPPPGHQEVAALVDRFTVGRLEDMERNGLTSATLTAPPWSDDSWPIYTGEIARRYADPPAPDTDDWRRNVDPNGLDRKDPQPGELPYGRR